MKWLGGWITVLLMVGGVSNAAVKPHSLFTDGAVLQRGIGVPVWGTASVGEKVTVGIQGRDASTIARDGTWMVRLKPLKTGGPFKMTISGENTIELNNVLVGDVWVCSGQSNMQWPLSLTENAEKAMAESTEPMMRLYTVPMYSQRTPLADVNSQWNECNPQTTPGFSAIGYYFGRHLRQKLGVPIGLINTSWGGSAIEAWMSPKYLDGKKYVNILPDVAQYRPHALYNGMIAPLLPYGIRGAIWYQGETNVGRGYEYRSLMANMIREWREAWGLDFPFFMVQLASFLKGTPEPNGSGWAELRESQYVTTLTVPKTGMAVTTDLGDPVDIHPRRKAEVGERLALAARAIAYGEKLVYSGPVYKSMSIDGDKIALSFESIGGGLEARGGELTGFTIAGEDSKFVPAQAVIEGDKVVVRSTDVPKPAAVRFGWCIYPETNLYNKEGLPAPPFRTDSWKLSTQP